MLLPGCRSGCARLTALSAWIASRTTCSSPRCASPMRSRRPTTTRRSASHLASGKSAMGTMCGKSRSAICAPEPHGVSGTRKLSIPGRGRINYLNENFIFIVFALTYSSEQCPIIKCVVLCNQVCGAKHRLRLQARKNFRF